MLDAKEFFLNDTFRYCFAFIITAFNLHVFNLVFLFIFSSEILPAIITTKLRSKIFTNKFLITIQTSFIFHCSLPQLCLFICCVVKMKAKKQVKQKLHDEEKCVICGRKTKDSFAKLIMGFDKSPSKAILRYCSWDCLEDDHIKQFVDILLNHSDNKFLEDLLKLIGARKEVILAEAKAEAAENSLRH